METKTLLFNVEAREELLKGAKLLSDAVGATLGPRSSNVAIERKYGPPTVIHDGVGVAKEIDIKDPYQNMGIQLLKDAASKTNDLAGDGTTTATVLGYAIASEAHKNVVAGAQVMALREGINQAVTTMITALDELAIPVKSEEELLQVATISAQDKEIGEIVASGLSRMGTDGVLAVEQSPSTQTYLEIKEGMEFNRGWVSPYLINNPTLGECVLENSYILVTDMKFSTVPDMVGVLKKFIESSTDNKNLVILGEEIADQALALLIVNRTSGSVNPLAIKAPGYGEKSKDLLKDIAVVCGARFFSNEAGDKLSEETFRIEDLGRASKVISTEKNTVIIDGNGDPEKIAIKIEELKNTLIKSESDFDKEKLQERIARLTTGIGVVFVGAASEVEMKEKKERFIDAISAARAAKEEGIVPGGETALIRASRALKDLKASGDIALGIEIVRKAAQKPFQKLMSNAGYDEGRMLSQLETVLTKKNYGIDVLDATSKDLVTNGIIDPVKVTKQALLNAASCAIMMITTNVIVGIERVKEESYE